MGVPSALALAAAAGWLLAPPPSRALPSTAEEARPRPLSFEVVGALIGLACGALVLRAVVPAVVGAGLGAAVARAALGRRVHRRCEEVRAALPDVLRQVSAELVAGAAPHRALESAALGAPVLLAEHLRRSAAEIRLGSEPGRALRDPPPGAEGLVALAACWEVSAATGASLGHGVARLAAGLAAEGRVRAEVDAQLAGPRASAAAIACLPVVAAGMGAGLGASPLSFFRSPVGGACLAAGSRARGRWAALDESHRPRRAVVRALAALLAGLAAFTVVGTGRPAPTVARQRPLDRGAQRRRSGVGLALPALVGVAVAVGWGGRSGLAGGGAGRDGRSGAHRSRGES